MSVEFLVIVCLRAYVRVVCRQWQQVSGAWVRALERCASF